MKIKVTSLLETIIAFCILLDCESVWKWMNHSGYFRLILAVCFVGALLALSLRNGIKVNKHEKLLLFFLLLYFLIFGFYNLSINSSHGLDTLQLIVTILLMVLYFRDSKNIYNVMERCSKILCCLALLSLLFWLFGSILHILTPNQSLTVYISDVARIRQSYFYLHYEMQVDEVLGVGMYRNTGVFLEGPKYVLLLSFFLMYEIYISKKPNFKRCMMFTVTALTTMSMTGVYAVALIWVLYVFARYSSKSIKGLVLRVTFIIFLFVFGTKVVSYFDDMFSMKATTASYRTRMDNYQAGMAAWLDHIFMGAGYLNMDTVRAHFSSFRMNDVGYSNSIFRLLAQGGLYLLVIYVVPLVKAIANGARTRNGAILAFALVFIYFFITTSFTYNYIVFLILCLLYFGNTQLKPSKTLKKGI